MLTNNLLIYKDTYSFILQLMKYINNFPKRIQYGQGEKSIDISLSALDLIYVANSSIEDRYENLTKFLQLIGAVRSRIRLFGEMRYLSVKQTTILMLMLDKIVKQAINWRNASKNTKSIKSPDT